MLTGCQGPAEESRKKVDPRCPDGTNSSLSGCGTLRAKRGNKSVALPRRLSLGRYGQTVAVHCFALRL